MTTDPRESKRSFSFNYQPGELRVGRGCVSKLSDVLSARDLGRALVITGTNVGSNRKVMDPVRDGLEDRLLAVFDETGPEKYLSTGLAAADTVRDQQIDSLVAVGGGSTLDIAKVTSALTSYDIPLRGAEEALETGEVTIGMERDPLSIVAVPTTLAGADLSMIAGVGLTLEPEGTPDEDIEAGGVADRRLMPTALFYDPALIETTPKPILCASAMNGFDKAVECLYSPYATPITDATAMRALSLMQSGFATLPEADMDGRQLYDSIVGIMLAQYGLSTSDAYRASLIHAFGHGFNDFGIHQGTAHAILAPHVLSYLFDEIDGRRNLLADALGVKDPNASDAELAEGIVDEVAAIAADLSLPSRLQEVTGLDRTDLPSIATEIQEDSFMNHTPEGIEPDSSDIRAVLEEAW